MIKYPFTCLLFLGFVLLAGCSAKYPHLESIAPLPAPGTCRIAVLPFVDHGTYPRGEQIFNKAFASAVTFQGKLDLVPEGDVLALYRQLRLYRRDQPNETQLQFIGDRLDAQFIVVGDIVRMKETDTGRDVDTEITVSIRLHEGSTGRILWDTYHKRRGDEYRNVLHYGRVNTITGLSRRMAEEIMEVWIEEGMDQCSSQ